ncbi:hypothetical protein FQZ97_1028830 [compost metagenome]
MSREQGYTDTAVSGQKQGVQPERPAQGFQCFARGLYRVAGIHPWKQHRERGFGYTGDYFVGVQHFPQPCRHFLQESVTLAVAQRFVDFAEIVDLDMQQGNRVVRIP